MQVGGVNSLISDTKTTVQAGVDKAIRAKKLEEHIVKNMPNSIKAITKMSKFTGELPNIVINALGTAFVAPIFIKYNFLSKTDEDTRTYSAWRQPVSAALSVATSVLAVMPFNWLIDDMSKNGSFKNLKTGQVSTNYSKPSEKVDDIVKRITSSGNFEYKSGAKNIKLTEAEVKNLVEKTLAEKVKEIDINLDRHDTEKIGKKISRAEYCRNNSDKVNELLSELNKGIKDAKSQKEISKLFKSKLSELKSKKENKELIGILEDISFRPDADTMKAKIEDVFKANSKYSKMKSLEEVSREIASKVDAENAALRAEKVALTEMQTALKEGKSLRSINKISNKIKGSTFLHDVVQKHVDNVGANIKGFKAIAGLALSLAILPVACSLLNYLYPKFMDKFFPELSDKKKSKTADTFQKSATPSEEVKKGGRN